MLPYRSMVVVVSSLEYYIVENDPFSLAKMVHFRHPAVALDAYPGIGILLRHISGKEVRESEEETLLIANSKLECAIKCWQLLNGE